MGVFYSLALMLQGQVDYTTTVALGTVSVDIRLLSSFPFSRLFVYFSWVLGIGQDLGLLCNHSTTELHT